MIPKVPYCYICARGSWYHTAIFVPEVFSTILQYVGTILSYVGTILLYFGTVLRYVGTIVPYFGTILLYSGTIMPVFGTKCWYQITILYYSWHGRIFYIRYHTVVLMPQVFGTILQYFGTMLPYSGTIGALFGTIRFQILVSNHHPLLLAIWVYFPYILMKPYIHECRDN